MCQVVHQLHQQHLTCKAIAQHLNQSGFRPPKRRDTFNESIVASLLRQLDLTQPQPQLDYQDGLQQDEWFLTQLAHSIGMPAVTLYHWLKRGWLSARQEPRFPRRWIIWADEAEFQRLRDLHRQPPGEATRQRWINQRNAHLQPAQTP